MHYVIANLPGEDIVYFADTANIPYGPKSQKLIEEIVLSSIKHLIKKLNPKLVVIACNTATAAALQSAKMNFDVDILGTAVQLTVEDAINCSSKGKIGIIATEATVKSALYQGEIMRQNGNIEIFAKAIPEFVDIVENNLLSKKIIKNTIVEKLHIFKEIGIDVLILGCTHFPFLKQDIKIFLGENIKIIDNGEFTSKNIKNLLDRKNICSNKKKTNAIFYTSQKEKIDKNFLNFGANYLGIEKIEFKEISI